MIAVIAQTREDSGLNLVRGDRNGKIWMDLEYTLEVESTGHTCRREDNRTSKERNKK